MYLLARKTVIKLIDVQLTFAGPGARGQIEATHQMLKYLEMKAMPLAQFMFPSRDLKLTPW